MKPVPETVTTPVTEFDRQDVVRLQRLTSGRKTPKRFAMTTRLLADRFSWAHVNRGSGRFDKLYFELRKHSGEKRNDEASKLLRTAPVLFLNGGPHNMRVEVTRDPFVQKHIDKDILAGMYLVKLGRDESPFGSSQDDHDELEKEMQELLPSRRVGVDWVIALDYQTIVTAEWVAAFKDPNDALLVVIARKGAC